MSTQVRTVQLTNKEWAVFVIGTVLGIAGLRADDLWIVIPCLTGCWLAFLFICISQPWAKRWRIITSFLVFCVFVALTARIYFHHLAEDQDDVYQRLSARVEVPASGDVMNSFFVITNNSKTRLAETGWCGVHLIAGNEGNVGRLSVLGLPYGGSLGAGGEAQSFQCLKLMSNYVGTVDCADVEFELDYKLESQPKVQKKKYFRFTGYRDQNQFVFVPQIPGGEKDSKDDDLQYCGKYLPKPLPEPWR